MTTPDRPSPPAGAPRDARVGDDDPACTCRALPAEECVKHGPAPTGHDILASWPAEHSISAADLMREWARLISERADLLRALDRVRAYLLSAVQGLHPCEEEPGACPWDDVHAEIDAIDMALQRASGPK